MHAAQAIECLRAGKHVMIEIPIADSLADSQRVVEAQRASGGLVAMGGHTRRFNPSHQWIHKRIQAGDQGAANGRADLLFPPYQHECARQAAQLDRPPALASCLPHGRPVSVPERTARVREFRAAGAAEPTLGIAWT